MSRRTTEDTTTDQVVDFNQARAQKLDEKRRKTERIFFQQMLGVYCVSGNSQITPLELVEVSEEGCSFQVPFEGKGSQPWPTDLKEIPIRLYFSQDTYLGINLRIQNSRACIDKGSRYIRYGCSIDKELSSYPAYQQFVKFLRLYAEHAHKDMGDATVFYI